MFSNNSSTDTQLTKKDAFTFGSLIIQTLFVIFLFFRMEAIDSRVDDLTVTIGQQLTELRDDVRNNNVRMFDQMDRITTLVEKQNIQNTKVLEIVQRPTPPALNIRTGSHDVEVIEATIKR